MAIRLGGALKELRIHLCQTSKSSEGIREFIKNRYVELKKANPEFPILVRECNGVEARIWARYEALHEVCYSLKNKNESDIHVIISKLATTEEQKEVPQPTISELLTS